MNQKQSVLNALKHRSRKGLSQAEAMVLLGVICLHKRIAEIEKDGVEVERLKVFHTNRHGNRADYFRYRLA